MRRITFLYTILNFLVLSSCSKLIIRDEILQKTSFPNWFQSGNNPQRTNFYPHSVSPPFNLVWQYNASSAIEKTLIAVDGILYFNTKDGKTFAMHIKTGEEIGDKKLDIGATYAYHNHHLLIAKRYGDDTMFDLNLTTNKFDWQINAGDIESEPLICSDNIVIAALYNHIDLYTIDSGVKIWTFETEDQIRSTPAATKNIIVFGSDDCYVYAINSLSGKVVWKFKAEASVQFTPAIDIADDVVYIGSSDHTFYALRIEDGSEKWRFKTNGKILTGSAVSDQYVCFGSTDRNLYCLDKQTGTLIWKNTAKSVISTNPIISGDNVFWGSLDHCFYAADLHTGQIVWQYETKGRIRTDPIFWGNYFIGASEDNFIYAFKPKGD